MKTKIILFTLLLLTIQVGWAQINPTSTNSQSATAVANNSAIFATLYDYHLNGSSGDGFENAGNNFDWQSGLGGDSSYYFYYVGEENSQESYLTWPASAWPQTPPSGSGIYVFLIYTNGISGVPLPSVGEHCHANLAGNGFNYHKDADAEYELATGGATGSKAQNLWVISASVTAEALEDVWDSYWDVPASSVGVGSVPAGQITIGNLGQLGSDGNLYILLPDNTTMDVTPKVSGNDQYSFTVTATKYKLSITANGQDLSTNTPQFCVGQQVNLQATWNPPLPSGTQTNYDWFASLDFINGWNAAIYSDGSTYPTINPSILTGFTFLVQSMS
jgi:hypothetical protein